MFDMRFTRRALISSLVLVGLTSITGLHAGAANQPKAKDSHEQKVCGSPGPNEVHCLAHVAKRGHSSTGAPMATSSATPVGLSPSQVQSAYKLDASSTAGAGKTIAIVDAYDDPTAEQDLAAFSSQYGLPACTTANGCFSKVDQTGGTNYPAPNGIWALEISLDLQWAHAVAPGARILLVEASNASWSDLLAAVDYASAHAAYVSNSWGAPEFQDETNYDVHFRTPGVSYFVASGDNGALPEYPSTSPNVISVGGTTLQFDTSGAFTQESAWSNGGGGCSSYEAAAAAQSAFAQYAAVGCSGTRATPDVSLVGDPASGVAVYDSTPYQNQTGWWQVGGTSASTPMIAARAAVAGITLDASTIYGSTLPYRDIVSGSNGYPATTGFDMATGRGSWAYATSGSGGGTGGTGGTGSSPTAPFAASFSTSCSQSTCTFTSTSTDGLGTIQKYKWSGGNGLGGTSSSVTHAYTGTGTFSVQLTVTDSRRKNATAKGTVTCTKPSGSTLVCA